jgi:hypothetical protein
MTDGGHSGVHLTGAAISLRTPRMKGNSKLCYGLRSCIMRITDNNLQSSRKYFSITLHTQLFSCTYRLS